MAETFSLDITKFAEKAKGRIDLVIRKVALDVSSRVIMRTPVDTGRARANWQPALGYMPNGTMEATDPIGAQTVAGVAGTVRTLKAGQTFYLANNLDYIRLLEYGHSKLQAPQGMLRVTLREYPGMVSDAVSEAKSEKA